MFRYQKEREVIKAFDETGKFRGSVNLYTLEFIGIKGQPVKNRPAAFQKLTYSENDILKDNLCGLFGLLAMRTSYTYETLAPRLEQIISLGLRFYPDLGTIQLLANDKTPLNKNFVQFLKEDNNSFYNNSGLQLYKFCLKHKTLFDKIEDEKEREYADAVVRYIISYGSKDIPIDWVHNMILRGLHEKVFITHSSSQFSDILTQWYDIIISMKDTLEVKHNILTNWTILKWLYNTYQREHTDELLAANNDKPWLHFENETFIVIPLTSRQMFHMEAEYQRNCVERIYLERVLNNGTYVVAIRRKDNPDIPYITCEVTRNHIINQYLTRFNEHVRDPEAKQFYHQYQKHLTLSPQT